MNVETSGSIWDFIKLLFFSLDEVVPKQQTAYNIVPFSKSFNKKTPEPGSSTYYNTELLGNLKSETSLLLDKKCRVNGSVTGRQVELSGEVFGDVTSKEFLILNETAIIHGNVKAKRLLTHPSAIIKGECDAEYLMSPSGLTG